MRILQIMRAPVGGLFRHVADLSAELAARGHEVGIVADSLVEDGATQARFAGLLPHCALGIHRLPMPRLFGGADLVTPGRIAGLANRLGVTILHGHGAKGGFYARLARRQGQLVFYTPHGGVLHFAPGSVAGRSFRQIERALMGRTTAIIFESRFAQEAFARQIGPPTCASSVVHNGLQPAEFVPVPLRPDAAQFCYVGELRELKGIFVLLSAFAALAKERGPALRLVMAGDGPDRGRLEAEIGRLGLGDQITLLGVRPVREVMAQGQCLVVPSLAESLPYVVLEAGAAGHQMLATAVGGIAEIFGPTADRLVPAGDAPALTHAMAQMLVNPDLAAREARRAHIEKGFTVSAMTDAITALYGGQSGQA